MLKPRTLTLTILSALLALACASAPETRMEAATLESEADATLTAMVQTDETLKPLLLASVGYVVFPEVTEAAFVAGATAGTGVLYEGGTPVGHVTLNGGSVGAQVGGQTYSELIILSSPEALQRVRGDSFELDADLSATLIEQGAAESTSFRDGTAVFVTFQEGVMAEASIGTQRLDYEPAS